MKLHQSNLILALSAAFLLVLGIAGLATRRTASVVAEGTPSKGTMEDPVVTLNLDLPSGSTDLDIDPGRQNWATHLSNAVIDQLFLGLFRFNDATHEPELQLAQSWPEVSADTTVYTVTLRSDVDWSDGNPVTAQDVRYALLRTLDPAVNGSVSVFYIINNAEAFYEGLVTGDQVGIKVLSPTSLRFELNAPAAFFPAVLATPAAKALPEWVINAHPADWTEPGNIVTNGPYRLTAWDHSKPLITLQKNPDYFDAASVQIGEVRFRMEDASAAWSDYLSGQIDSVRVPEGEWAAAINNPSLQPQLQGISTGCLYYYGFNTAKEPFDNPLVRKAFIAAIDRQTIIDDAIGYAQMPAVTLSPPSVFGYVDGYSEGVGIPYNPSQAQQLLSAAGYPGGAGLPSITLVYNANPGHQAVAESVRQQWATTLGVTVSLSDLDWAQYLELLNVDPPQIWRMGWCVDYNDAYNVLYTAIDPARFGGWSNASYDSLLEQAAHTTDLAGRRLLYKQAEEIVVETDAITLPLYFYANGFATKPALHRGYAAGGYGGFIADWQMDVGSSNFLPVALKNVCGPYPQDHEVEDNDKPSQANGPLCLNRLYLGNPDNDIAQLDGGIEFDYYYYSWSGIGTLSVDVTGFLPEGQVLLYHESNTNANAYLIRDVNQVDRHYHLAYDGPLGAGNYYVLVYALANHTLNNGDYLLKISVSQ